MKNSLAVIFLLVIIIVISASCPLVQAEDRQIYKWSVEMRSGAFWPDSDEWEKIYGRDAAILSEIHLRYQLLPRLEVGSALGFLIKNGHGQTRSGETSDQDYSILLAPLQIEGVYRFDFLTDQLLVPYVKAGLDLWLFREEGEGDSKEWSGTKSGFHGGAGFQLLLDRLDPEGARNFLRSTGIVNSYIIMDARYAKVDNFGSSDLDLSGWIIQAGLLFQF